MSKNKTLVSHQRLLELLSYLPETGSFTWRVERRRSQPVGSKTAQRPDAGGYLHVGIDGIVYRAHRLAWFYVHGEWPKMDLDHINGDKIDNRISNLRLATTSQNGMNSKRRADAKAKYRGVCFHKQSKSWVVKFRGKYIGIRRTEEDAHALYLGELAKLETSFPVPQHPAHQVLAA